MTADVQRGFTLVEVIIITGVLLGIGFCIAKPSLGGLSIEDEALHWARELRQAELAFLETHGRYWGFAKQFEDAYPTALPSQWGEGPAGFSKLGLTVPQHPLRFRVAVFAGARSPLAIPCEPALVLCKNAPRDTRPWFYLVVRDANNKPMLEDAAWAPSPRVVEH